MLKPSCSNTNVRFVICFLLDVVQISATGATIGGLNFNNSASGAAAANLSSRVSLPLAPVADAGKNQLILFSVVCLRVSVSVTIKIRLQYIPF